MTAASEEIAAPLDDVDEETAYAVVSERMEDFTRMQATALTFAKQRMKEYKQAMKIRYDAKAKARQFMVGDKVMVHNEALSPMSTDLAPHWIGPYAVDKRLGYDTYKLRDEALSLPGVFHANRLKFYYTRPRLERTSIRHEHELWYQS
ncbi:hypothetical protein BDB00DRAFT_879545 [Zychaea mexicana]|uniref:uncharacterized protein n=1 Tax=Zychaea mexicana TaxID=64656 RepID=UPI0022FDF048|nr:uncharacterized protein BDB00DRAFT_879545 [Zychaea mexicana]KAI9477059.1 hypothetical protein BDB00DRAFT_879545 [Zychaea mexicana]